MAPAQDGFGGSVPTTQRHFALMIRVGATKAQEGAPKGLIGLANETLL